MSVTLTPPNAINSEACVIGALIMGGSDPMLAAEIRAGLDASMFYQPDHAILYKVCCAIIDKRGKIDGAILREELIRQKLHAEVGGDVYLAEILNSCPAAANGAQYAADVRDAAGWREVIRLADKARAMAYGKHERDELAEHTAVIANEFAGLAVNGAASTIITLSDAVQTVLNRRHEDKNVRRIPTGLRDLDNVINGGLPVGLFTIIGADPRVGKSQLIKQILRNIAARGIPVGLISIEEDRGKIGENTLAALSGVKNAKIAGGNISDNEWRTIEDAAIDVTDIPIFIDDLSFDLRAIVTSIQRMALKHGCRVIAVDHLHIIDGNIEHREREIATISKTLKKQFRQLKVAGVAAAQLNRAEREKPTLRSLRDSKSLESDGDIILLLHREDAYRYNQDGYRPTNLMEINVAKSKSGNHAEIPVTFNGDSQTVTDWEVTDPFAKEAEDLGVI